MGIREWIGIKQCRISAKSCRTLDELFKRIRNESFSAGRPEIFRKEDVIAFPPIDDRNQVQIYGDNGEFTVMRSTMPIEGGKAASGIENLPPSAGSRRALCIELCQETADQIEAMGL